MQHAIAARALFNASASGDQCRVWHDTAGSWLCMVDGLGHGPEAEAAALAALDYVEAHRAQPLSLLFSGCDRALRGTRGVAMELIHIGPAGALTYAGIGNTAARHWQGGPGRSERLSGNYGIVGGGYRSLTPRKSQIAAGDLLILHTDGISEKFDLSAYRDCFAEPARLAQRLLLDWGKAHDDAAVLVYRHEAPCA